MKCFISLLVTFVSINVSYSQKNDSYLFSSEIELKMKTDTLARNYQHYAINYMNIGNYEKTLLTEELFINNFKGLNHKPTKVDNTFLSYYPVNAIETIIEKSLKHQVVIINEAHYSAQNRVFTQVVLQQLYSKGYKTFFAETLINSSNPNFDALLNERKYPLKSSGYYLKEPQYGNMIRKALKLGYEVLPYEHIPDNSEKDAMKRWSLREQGQAQNILNFLNKYPNEKIIIHCGYGHLGEKLHDGNFGMMGAVLKLKSGLDPFTISQTLWLETYSEDTKNPYRSIIDNNPPKEVSIFKNAKGELFSSDKENYDVEIYFPETKYINGRPDWLMMANDRIFVDIPFSKITVNYPYLVKAYYTNETDKNAVPADIVEITSKNSVKSLVLEKGNYKLLIVGKNDKIQSIVLKVK